MLPPNVTISKKGDCEARHPTILPPCWENEGLVITIFGGSEPCYPIWAETAETAETAEVAEMIAGGVGSQGFQEVTTRDLCSRSRTVVTWGDTG